MPFVTCAACGCDTLILFGSRSAGYCRNCSAPLAGDSHEEPWVVRIGHPGFDVVKVGGPLAGDFVALVAAELETSGDRAAVLDLGHCTFVDAGAIELMTRCAAAVAGDPAFFSVVGAHGTVARMLDFALGAQAIPRFPDLGAALAGLRSEAPMI
jgi:hypothetical protein